MSAVLPETVEAWRMIAARRRFEGGLPLAAMMRLVGALKDSEGECQFTIEFGRDELGIAFVDIEAEAALPLLCQRSLEPFRYPVRISQRLGLIVDEDDEAALPQGYEAVLVPEDGMLRLVELIEDELILALPAVPVAPGTLAVEQQWSPPADERERVSPFAALAELKRKK